MMKRLHWMVLRMLPGPFLGWLGTLMFLLVMQFLIKYLPDLAGKGLPLLVIVELIAYSLAYMVVLAVPMAVLLATLMTFGRLSESNAYAVIKSSGISLIQLIWPALIAGLLVTGGMTYFNNVVLPEANFRARNLWLDIQTKKPGFELQPGIFYEGLSGYSILVDARVPGSNILKGVTIYDYTHSGDGQTVIKAQRGRLETLAGGTRVELTLEDGEIHRLQTDGLESRYERLAFGRHRLYLNLSDFVFERSEPNDGYRTDRTMPTAQMIEVVDSLRQQVRRERRELRRTAWILPPDSLATDSLAMDDGPPEPAIVLPAAAAAAAAPSDTVAPPTQRVALTGEGSLSRHRIYAKALRSAREIHTKAEAARQSIKWQAREADRYLVEIYKKFSIAVACFIFTLIGAPLGLSIRRGGLGTVGGLALGIFLFYWITLVQGEKLADRGLLDPWVGMWIANAVMLVVGLWLVAYVTLDLRATPPLRKRLQTWLQRKIRN